MDRVLLTAAAINGLLAVAAGAFGAHGLRESLAGRAFELYETAVRYQMFHTVGLVAAGWAAGRGATAVLRACGVCFAAGIVLFSGSLYALSLTGWRALGAITPVGGVLFLVGWVLLARAAWRMPDRVPRRQTPPQETTGAETR